MQVKRERSYSPTALMTSRTFALDSGRPLPETARPAVSPSCVDSPEYSYPQAMNTSEPRYRSRTEGDLNLSASDSDGGAPVVDLLESSRQILDPFGPSVSLDSLSFGGDGDMDGDGLDSSSGQVCNHSCCDHHCLSCFNRCPRICRHCPSHYSCG